MKVFLRPATINDAPILEHWDRQTHVLKARNLTAPDSEWIWQVELSRYIAGRKLLIGEVDNRPVAFLQIIDPLEEETHYWGEAPSHHRALEIWIGEEADLGRGYGTILMDLALDRCFANESVQGVLIDPLIENKRTHRFYERLGFVFIESKIFGDDPCFVYRLNRSDWMVRAQRLLTVECAGGLLVKDEKFLFGRRAASAAWYQGVWDVIGGHNETGEMPEATLARELKEELNIVPVQYHLAGVFNYFEGSVQKYVRYYHFFVTEWTGEIKACGEEHTEVRWFKPSELDAIPLAAKEYAELIDAWMQTHTFTTKD